MKKKLGIVIGTITGAAVLGLGVFQSSAAQADPKLSTDEIRQMITDQYQGVITEMELDKEFNKAVYEVEIEGEKEEIELKLDGDTGEVIKEHKKERKNDGVKISEVENKQNNGDILSTEEVTKIALNEFSGTVTDLELDEDDDYLIYEIEIKDGQDEADFEIDAATGKIIELEIETDEDEDDDRFDD